MEFLLGHKLIKPISLPRLEKVYSKHSKDITEKASKTFAFEAASQEKAAKEDILLKVSDGKELAELLEAHELVAEVERAVHQVEHSLKKGKA